MCLVLVLTNSNVLDTCVVEIVKVLDEWEILRYELCYSE